MRFETNMGMRAVGANSLPQAGGSYESRLAVAKQLDAACVDLGCFYLEGHGVPESQAGAGRFHFVCVRDK